MTERLSRCMAWVKLEFNAGDNKRKKWMKCSGHVGSSCCWLPEPIVSIFIQRSFHDKLRPYSDGFISIHEPHLQQGKSTNAYNHAIHWKYFILYLVQLNQHLSHDAHIVIPVFRGTNPLREINNDWSWHQLYTLFRLYHQPKNNRPRSVIFMWILPCFTTQRGASR